MTKNEIIKLINDELESANSKHPGFSSVHEGYAVIKEEVDELWDEIKVSKSIGSNMLMVNEAVQIAAMAIKFIETLYKNNKKPHPYVEIFEGKITKADEEFLAKYNKPLEPIHR